MTFATDVDRRTKRTEQAVFSAFRELVLSRPYSEITVQDIVQHAQIGRSTFYEHFSGKDDVLKTSITPLFDAMADVAVGRGEAAKLDFVLEHFWEQRQFARILLAGRPLDRLIDRLTELIEARATRAEVVGDVPSRLRSRAEASWQLGLVRAWVFGEARCDSSAIRDYMLERQKALRASP